MTDDSKLPAQSPAGTSIGSAATPAGAPAAADRPASVSPRKDLPPAAQRALAEAEARRAKAREQDKIHHGPKEIGGPDGPEPTRYGDWENKGIASDF